MNFLFKIILLTILLCSGAFSETNISSLENKVTYHVLTQQKFPFNKSEDFASHHSKPYMSKGRSAIFRTVLNSVPRLEKKAMNMSSIEK